MEIPRENSFNKDYSESGLYQKLRETHPDEIENYLYGVFKVIRHGKGSEITRRVNEMLAYVYNKEAEDRPIDNHTILSKVVYDFIPLIKQPEEIEEIQDLKSFLTDIPKQFEDDSTIEGTCLVGLTHLD